MPHATPDAALPSPPDAAAAFCPPGTSEAARQTDCGTASAPPPALLAGAAAATAGQTLDLVGIDTSVLPCAPTLVCVPDDAPTLVFSDEPESVDSDGILYADTPPPGRVRVYLYHVAAGATPRTFSIVALNESDTPASLTVERAGVSGPTNSYAYAGKVAAQRWATPVSRVITVPPGKRELLDETLPTLIASDGKLVHAVLDLRTEAHLKISVVSLATDAAGRPRDARELAAGLALIPRADDRHTRGTFAGAELVMVVSQPPDGLARLRIGAGGADPTRTGRSAVDGTEETLGGNFGVPYRFAVGVGARTALLVVPRGGAWAGVGWLGSESAALLPDVAVTLGDSAHAIFLGAGTPPVTATLMTGGGSNLPIDVLVLPLGK